MRPLNDALEDKEFFRRVFLGLPTTYVMTKILEGKIAHASVKELGFNIIGIRNLIGLED